MRKIFQNRKDRIELTPETLTWVDNEINGDVGSSIKWEDIQEVTSEVTKIVVLLKDKSKKEILIQQMNMAVSSKSLIFDIKAYKERYGTGTTE